MPTNACAEDVCARCNSRKHRLVALTADAGQFYVVVQAHEAISAARHVLDKCSRMSRKHSVTVLRNKRISFLGLFCRHGYVFSFPDLFLAFAACLFLPFCILGDMESLQGEKVLHRLLMLP